VVAEDSLGRVVADNLVVVAKDSLGVVAEGSLGRLAAGILGVVEADSLSGVAEDSLDRAAAGSLGGGQLEAMAEQKMVSLAGQQHGSLQYRTAAGCHLSLGRH
jgi:hypothetical protein